VGRGVRHGAVSSPPQPELGIHSGYTPEFAAITAEIEADMAAQLERVREMQRNGELEPTPDISAAVQ
jgi:hypothetical protein